MSGPRIHLAMFKCVEWHGDQKRKYTDEPYHTHPIGVMAIVSNYTQDEDVLIAALLHDVLEDTSTSPEEIESLFGHKVLSLVKDLTKPKEYPSRSMRNILTNMALSKASDEVKLIKLADILHNVSTIMKHDPKFALLYLGEKQTQLRYLKIDHPLYNRVYLHVDYNYENARTT